MKCARVFLCALVTLAILAPSGMCDRTEEQELTLRRNRRTVQFLVNHFVHFFGLSGGGGGGTKKIEPKQDNVFALPLTNILKASAGKFSGSSGHKQKPAVPAREPTLQHDLPTWIDDRPQKIANPFSEALEADALEPTRVSLLSTTREAEETTTTSTTTEAPTTTTTPEPAPIAPTESVESEEPNTVTPGADVEEPSTDVPETDSNSSEDGNAAGPSSTETAAIDPSDVNRLSDTGLASRNDVRDDSFQPTPVPLVSYQHFVQPAVWTSPNYQHSSFPMQQYFGNNVFFPSHNAFPLASPFQVQSVIPAHSQGYPSHQPVYDNRLYYPTGADAQPKSHSRVKLHDNHYDLVTYHDDSEPAASTYQSQSFGNNYRARRY
uniref:Uncharacterized protein n=1 Tax=Anopheles farauti TaxID=69004 RepID=A0A182Q0M2_9DIPT